MDSIVLFSIPIALAFAHLSGLQWDIQSQRFVQPIRSFSAGFSVVYIFLFLIPEVVRLNGRLGFEPMLLVAFGFIFFHSTLKFVFKTRHPEDTTFLLDEIHLSAAGLYNFLVTFLLVTLTRDEPFRGLLIFFVILIHLILSEVAHAIPSTHETNLHKTQIIILATLAGGIVALLDVVTTSQTDALFAITAGAIMYIAIREEIPEDSDGKPWMFILGSGILMMLYILFFN